MKLTIKLSSHVIRKKGLFKLNICLNYICSLFAAGQVTVRTSYVRSWLARSVSLDHNQQTSKKVQPAPQIAQIDPRISRAIFEHNSLQKFSNWSYSDSTQLIFKFKTKSVREKVHLSFPARRFFKSRVNFQKISFENTLHTNKGRFYCIFKFKGILILALV